MITWPWQGRDEPRRRVYCRHCLKPFEEAHIAVACDSHVCSRVRDSNGRRGPRIFDAADRGMWRGHQLPLAELPCPFCKLIGNLDSVCPHCHQPLGIGEGEDHVLAIVGATASGKTHFLAAALHQLTEVRDEDHPWEVNLPERKLRRFREQYLDPLFEDLHVLPATPRGLEDEMRLPLVHRQDGRRGLLVFRDLSGETFLDPELLKQLGFLHYAPGVVLMADPLAFRDNGLSRRSTTLDQNPDAVEILRRYRRALETRSQRPGEQTLSLRPEDKLLAVAVTKADLMLDSGHSFWNGSGGGPWQDGRWQVHSADDAEARRWVEEHLSRRLVRETKSFAEVGWFFTSSIGYPLRPGRTELPEPPRPRGVLAPIFGLLDRLTRAEHTRLAGTEGPPRSGGGSAPDRCRQAGDEDWGGL